MTAPKSDAEMLRQYRTLADTQQEVIIEQRGRILAMEKRIAELEEERRWRKWPDDEEPVPGTIYEVTVEVANTTTHNWPPLRLVKLAVCRDDGSWLMSGKDRQRVLAFRPMPRPYEEDR